MYATRTVSHTAKVMAMFLPRTVTPFIDSRRLLTRQRMAFLWRRTLEPDTSVTEEEVPAEVISAYRRAVTQYRQSGMDIIRLGPHGETL